MRLTKSFILELILLLLFSGCATKPLREAMREPVPGIFEGRKPTSKGDFAALKQHGIHAILSLQTIRWTVDRERQRAAQNGIAFLNVPILASPLGPRERNVKAALEILATPSLRPIYIHCLLGRDRTEVILALYHVYYDNWPPQVAWDNMVREGGFKSRWGMIGFKWYFWRHYRKPNWVKNRMPVQTRATKIN